MKNEAFAIDTPSGFTLIELLIAISIVGIFAALTFPSMSGIIKDYKLRGAALQMVSSLQNVKMRAIKENAEVKIFHQIDGVTGEHYYQLFVDLDDDNTVDAGEAYSEVRFDSGITITSTMVTNVVGFTSRGMPSSGAGSVTIRQTGGRSIRIIISKYGNIRTE